MIGRARGVKVGDDAWAILVQWQDWAKEYKDSLAD